MMFPNKNNQMRSLRYGIGNQDLPKTNLVNALRYGTQLGLEFISPASDIKEYQEGVKQAATGDLIGIPRAAAGLAGVFIPGSKYIREGGQKVSKTLDDKINEFINDKFKKTKFKKGTKLYHGTSADVKSPIDLDPYAERKIYNVDAESSLNKERGVTYFTDDPKFAEEFIPIEGFRDYKKGSKIIFGKLDTDKIFNINDSNDYKKLYKALEKKYGKKYTEKTLSKVKDLDEKELKDLLDEFGTPGLIKKDYYILEQPEVRETIEQLGYDGFETLEDVYRGKKAVGLFNPKVSVKNNKTLKEIFDEEYK